MLYLRAPEGQVFASAILSPSQPRSSQDQINGREVERLYDRALAAFWTERWEETIALLQQVLAHRPQHHPDVAVKLEQARHRQQLATRYARGCAAVEALDWEEAVKMFSMIMKADPTYRDIGERLDNTRRQQQLAGLHAEVRRLYQAEQWTAVVKIGEQLQILDSTAAAPDGLVSSAQAGSFTSMSQYNAGFTCSKPANGRRRSRRWNRWIPPTGAPQLCWSELARNSPT